MKKILLPILICVLTLSSSARLRSDYVPFHQYLQNKHGDIQQHGNQRAIAYKEIGYLHLIPANSDTTWTYADSGVYTYTSLAYETGGLFYSFADPKWDTTSAFNADIDSSSGFTHSLTGQNYNAGTFTNAYRYVYTYYSNNYLNTQTLQRWDGSNWVDSIAYTYTFDSNNFLTTVVAQKGSPLQNDSQYVYTNVGYNNTQVITQAWISGSWVNAFKVNNSFDANGNKYQSFGYNWDGSNWVNYDLFVQGFDLDNNLVSYLYEVWNANAGTYVNNYQEAYAYVLGNNTRYQNYNWDSTSATWTPNVLYTYSYDINNNATYELDQQYQNGAFKGTGQYFYYYNSFTVSGIKPVTNNLTVGLYPNPSTGNAQVSFTSEKATSVLINVYDAQGNLLLQQKANATTGSNQVPVNFSSYAAGNYYLQIVDGADSKSGLLKFVKQ